MRLPPLLRTSAVRLVLRYVLVYAVVLGIGLAVLWWFMLQVVDSEAEQELAQEFRDLLARPEALVDAIALRVADADSRRWYLLVSADDEKLAGNMRVWPPEPEIPLDGQVHRLWVDEDAFTPGQYEDEPYLPVVASRLPDRGRLLLARGVPQAGPLRETVLYLVEVLSVAAVLSLILGLVMGRAILGRMDAVSRTAGEIMRGDLAQRVPVAGRDDEFDALAGRLNAMLERIQQLVRGMREVTDNVAHDLRRPLARLRNRMEVTLLEPRGEAEYREVLAQAIEDSDSLIKTFNALLDIAQAEAGHQRSDWGPVNLNDLAHDLAELYQPAAEEKELVFELEVRPGVSIHGSRDLLAQAIGNLLENAIKYTAAKGRVRLQVRSVAGAAEVVVADTGPGIPEPERQHVLERFVRLESARNTPGNGLGLSLVKAVATAHRADLMMDDARPGLQVTMRFGRDP